MNKKSFIKKICLLVIIICLFLLLRQAYSEYKISKTAEEARLAYEQAINQKKPTAMPTLTPAITPPITEPPASTLTPTPTPLPTPTPTPKVIQQVFEELRSQYNNDDIIGYLKIPDTSIDYPVTQAVDNAYYLHHDINKNASEAGWIFMDYENDIENDDPNIIIYGHNMRQNIMFHSLRYYQSWDYFNDHRYIVFNTIYDNYVWEIFSFYRAETSFPYIQVFFPSDEAFIDLANEMKARSMYDTDVDIKPDDHILTLSTCTNESDDTRFVLNARRLSLEEIPEGF